MLGPQPLHKTGRKTLVLDLDETLVRRMGYVDLKSEIRFSITDGEAVHHEYVRKRPGVNEFLIKMSQYYEIVFFTAGTNYYANQIVS